MDTGKKYNFGINIINLLRIYDIKSQNQLADDLDIDPGRMSKYINGKVEPSRNDLIKLAHYFSESPESLLYGDYSRVLGNKIDTNDLFIKYSQLFPVFVSEKSRNNQHFMKAFVEQEKIIERLHNLFFYFEDVDIDMIFDEYENSVETDKSIEKEVYANCLSLLFLYIILGRCKSVLSAGIDQLPLLVKKDLHNDEKRYFYNMNREVLISGDLEFRKMIDDPEFHELLEESYYKLKGSSEWADLADYYICLQYIWGAVTNTFSYVQNKKFGQELLITFANCGNPYADDYLNTMFIT